MNNESNKYYLSPVLKVIIACFISLTLSLQGFCLAKSEHRLTIIHTNDVHGRLAPFDYTPSLQSVGGIARRATLIKEIKSSNPDNLLLDAGDTVQGSIFYQIFSGIPDIEIMNKIGYDAVTLGNHEFDKGLTSLEKLVSGAKFPYLSANIKFTKNKELSDRVKGYVIKDIDGLKIGIIGVTTDDIKVLSNDTDSLQVSDDIKIVRKIAKNIKKQCDFIIVLSHIGFNEDIELAKAVPEINLIVGGHSHTLLKNPYSVSEDGKSPMILQDGEFGVYLGQLDLTIEKNRIKTYKYRQIPVDKNVKEDQEIKQQVEKLQKQIEYLTNNIVGTLQNPLDARKETVRTGLTNAGCLVTAAIKAKFPDVDIVMQNSGGIRAHRYLNKGTITLADINELCPFDNRIILLELTGKDLKSVLEGSARELPEGSGAFMQTLGIDYTIDLSKRAQRMTDDKTKIIKEGKRVSGVKINGVPLDENKIYKIATNDFILRGGDGYVQFKKAKNIVHTDLFLPHLVIEYIKKNSPVSVNISNTVNIIEKTKADFR